MDILPILSWVIPLVVSLGVVFVGSIAYRPALAKAVADTQERLDKVRKEENEALREQIAELRDEVERQKAEVERQKQVQDTLRYVLKPMGIDISVEGDFVRVYESASAKALTVAPVRKPVAKAPPATPTTRTRRKATGDDESLPRLIKP